MRRWNLLLLDLLKRCDVRADCQDKSDEVGCKVLTNAREIMDGYIKVSYQKQNYLIYNYFGQKQVK